MLIDLSHFIKYLSELVISFNARNVQALRVMPGVTLIHPCEAT